MERREPGRTKGIVLPLLFCFVLLACQSPEKTTRAKKYFNAEQANIRTQRGITYLGKEPLSGTVFSLDAAGDTILLVPYLNGKENGIAKAWYRKKQLKEIRYFVNGKKEGRHYGWHENGKPRFEYFFRNDEFNGSFKEWLPDGTLLLNLNFENGHENGLQQTWFADGKIKSNYIIKNGRRYGLLGTKNCVNVSDDIPR